MIPNEESRKEERSKEGSVPCNSLYTRAMSSKLRFEWFYDRAGNSRILSLPYDDEKRDNFAKLMCLLKEIQGEAEREGNEVELTVGFKGRIFRQSGKFVFLLVLLLITSARTSG